MPKLVIQVPLLPLLLVGLLFPVAVCHTSQAIDADKLVAGEWISLFNGRDTALWVKAKRPDPSHPWKAVDGTLTNAGNFGMDLCTEDEFTDYDLELEYRLPKRGGNSGVFLRGQIEVQIDAAFGQKRLSKHRMGAIYDIHAPLANSQKPLGEWNHLRVRHVGLRISVWHNGVLIQDNVFVDEHTSSGMLESVHRDRRGLPLDLFKGPLMLQGDRSDVWYRDLRIRKLHMPEDGSEHARKEVDFGRLRRWDDAVP